MNSPELVVVKVTEQENSALAVAIMAACEKRIERGRVRACMGERGDWTHEEDRYE
jgi:hypothetical protein